MNRRNFLQLAGLSAAAFALDPERLLWVPGQKTIFIPSSVVDNPRIGVTLPFLRFYDASGLVLMKEIRIDPDSGAHISFERRGGELRRIEKRQRIFT